MALRQSGDVLRGMPALTGSDPLAAQFGHVLRDKPAAASKRVLAQTAAADRHDANPFETIPDVLKQHGLRAAHVAPHVGMAGFGGIEWSGHLPANPKLWQHYTHIRYDDAGYAWAAIVLDCDFGRERVEAMLMSGDLPNPNWIVWTPRGAHLTFNLDRPVGKHGKARRGPQQFLATVSEYLAHAAGADPSFGGLARNPLHPDAVTNFWRQEPYALAELGGCVPAAWKRPHRRELVTGVGRNCDVFVNSLQWAGHESNSHLPVIDEAMRLNCSLAHPMDAREVRGIAKSVERYRQQWAAQGWDSPSYAKKKRAQGRKGGVASGKVRAAQSIEKAEMVRLMKAEGMTNVSIAKALSMSREHVGRLLKKKCDMKLHS